MTTYHAVHLAVFAASRCSKQNLWFPLHVENHQYASPSIQKTVTITLLAKNTVPVFFLKDVTLWCNTLFTIGFGSKRRDQLPSNCTVTMICALYLLARNDTHLSVILWSFLMNAYFLLDAFHASCSW